MNRLSNLASVLKHVDLPGFPLAQRSLSPRPLSAPPPHSDRSSRPHARHILIVTDAWHPQVNGVVVALANLKEQLERRGYRVTVVHPGLFPNVPLPFYPEVRISLLARALFASMFSKIQPDYVHIATEGPLGLAARALCSRRGLEFTTSFHTHFQLYALSWFPRLLGPVHSYLRWFHSAASRTMVATPSLQQALLGHGLRNLVIWPLGVDAELFARNPSPPVPSLPRPVFAYFGRLSPEKSPEQFLRLPLPGTKLVIGGGPMRSSLEAAYGKSAIFAGYKRGQDLVNWLSRADVLVFPSRTDTFGLVILEALACRIPVAAHDVMGPRDILTPGVDGYLDQDLARAAVACLGLSGHACRDKALKYSWQNSAAAFIANLVPASLTDGLPEQAKHSFA